MSTETYQAQNLRELLNDCQDWLCEGVDPGNEEHMSRMALINSALDEPDPYRWRPGSEVPEEEGEYLIQRYGRFEVVFWVLDGWRDSRHGEDPLIHGPYRWRKIEPPPSFEEEGT